jgi:NADPH:quinone reductase-like Zn-dependent oxidoreductase
MFETKFPAILGGDIAGVIEAVGEGVTNVKPGDEIWALIGLTGAYAEYIVTSAEFVALKPKNLSFVEAASVPLALLTARLAIIDTAQVKAGQRVLVHAAAGGVGGFAVQIAHNAGAYVFGTSSTENTEFVKSLGADVAIDYKTQKLADVASDIDVAFDLIGGETQNSTWGVMKPGGILVSAGQPPDMAKAEAAGVRGARIMVRPNAAALTEYAADFEAGRLKTTVAAVYPLNEVGKAQQQSKAGHTRGKIVIKIAE